MMLVCEKSKASKLRQLRKTWLPTELRLEGKLIVLSVTQSW